MTLPNPPARPVSASPTLDITVLLVEADAALRMELTALLKSWGCRVLACDGAPDALILAENHRGPIQILLLDLFLELAFRGMSFSGGMEALRPEMRTLFLCDHPRNEKVRADLQACRPGFVSKPVEAATLRSKLERALAPRLVKTQGRMALPKGFR